METALTVTLLKGMRIKPEMCKQGPGLRALQSGTHTRFQGRPLFFYVPNPLLSLTHTHSHHGLQITSRQGPQLRHKAVKGQPHQEPPCLVPRRLPRPSLSHIPPRA